MKVLFVCSGNICRSPMAEGLLRARLHAAGISAVEVLSAGTLGITGEVADSGAVEAARDGGASIEGHLSRALSSELVRGSDPVLAMEAHHLKALRMIAPDHPGLHMLGEFLPREEREREGEDIADPIGGSDRGFRACREKIDRALGGLLHTYFARGAGLDRAAEEEAERRYFGELQERVLAARGAPPALSSMEFHLADRWWQAGIPLWSVIEAMEAAVRRWPEGRAPRGFLRLVDRDLRGGAVESPGSTGSRGVEDSWDAPSAVAERDRALAALEGASHRMGEEAMPVRDAVTLAMGRIRSSGESPEELRAALDGAWEALHAAARAHTPPEIMARFEAEERRRLALLGSRLSKGALEETWIRLVRDRILSHHGILPL